MCISCTYYHTYNVYSIVYTVQCTLYCIVYTTHWTVCILYCTLYWVYGVQIITFYLVHLSWTFHYIDVDRQSNKISNIHYTLYSMYFSICFCYVLSRWTLEASLTTITTKGRIIKPAEPFILLTKTTAAQNGVALSCHKVRGLYFLAAVFVRSIVAFMSILPVLKHNHYIEFSLFIIKSWPDAIIISINDV